MINNFSSRYMRDYPKGAHIPGTEIVKHYTDIQSIVFTKPFKNGMSLDRARGRDSWC